MIRVMLVDDEAIEREGLGMMLRKKRSNFEIVAEASNGEQAIELALLHKPDLIFMDIKMPEVDGMEAIKRIVPVLPGTKFIMVSAYDTFEYARGAMKFGIKEYLLKPSKVSDLLKAFDRMVAEIENEEQKRMEEKKVKQRLKSVSSFVEMEYIVSFIMDHVHEFTEKDWQEWVDLEEKQGFVAVFSFESDLIQPSREEKSQWYKLLKQTLHDHYPSSLVGPLTGFQVPVLMLFTDKDVADDKRTEEFARTVIHHVQHQLDDCRLYAGIGRLTTDGDKFSDSYKEAMAALEFVYNHPSASYMVYSDRVKQKRNKLIPLEVEKQLIDAVKKADMQTGLQLFETYFQLIERASDYQVRLIQKAMENFFIVINRSIKEMGFEADVETSLGHFETIMQYKQAAKAHLQMIIERLGDWRSRGGDAYFGQAREYLDNYYDKSISLEEVADWLGISSYYLSKLFKDKYQVTFIEYLTAKRLQKAKELLLDQTVPLKEIALSIGYKDPNYFSRVFKKETGTSPSEYRKKYL
ncbi:response regulator [Aquibacillus sediminis]|uniref:response regulator n=1 Tax=Aquibacillus sediminis TaxID=2574734 RepID=UPI00110897C5|nr:response regulator [Aquibacillus sediminis]